MKQEARAENDSGDKVEQLPRRPAPRAPHGILVGILVDSCQKHPGMTFTTSPAPVIPMHLRLESWRG